MRYSENVKSVQEKNANLLQIPKKTDSISKQASGEKEFSGIVVPPGCDNPMLHNCGEAVSTYTPASYNIKDLTLCPPPAMPGKIGRVSAPKNGGAMAQKTMTEYLNQFQGAYLCLDLWLDLHRKIKKCGILLEVGKDFLVLRENRDKKLTVIDLKPVRYIHIYCK